MVVLAGVLVAAIMLAGTGMSLPDRVKQAMCQAVGKILDQAGECSSGEPPKTDEDFRPEKCKVTEQKTQSRAAIKVAFIQVGENAGFVETHYSDGTVTLTATNGAEFGLTGGLGADAKLGDAFEAGAKVDFGGDVKVNSGSTWKFKNQQEADSMRKQLDTYLAQQQAMREPGGAMGVLIMGAEDPPKPPAEEITSIETGADVAGTLGINIKAPIDGGTYDRKGVVGGGGGIGGDAKWVKRSNSEDGTTTYTTDLKYSPEVNGQLMQGKGGGKGALGGSVSLKVDSDGRVVGVEMTHVVDSGSKFDFGANHGVTKDGDDPNSKKTKTGGSAGGTHEEGQQQVITTKLTLDPNSPDYESQSKIVDDWLSGRDPAQPHPLLVTDTSGMDVSTKDPTDPFQSLMHDRASVSAVDYKSEKNGFDFALNVKVGMALGVEGDFSDTKTESTGAQYLGAPQADGTRTPQPFPECQ